MVRCVKGKNGEPRGSRKKAVCVDMLLQYVRRLGYSKETFRAKLEDFRNAQRAGVNGPSEKAWRAILRTGLASDDFYASILTFIRSELQKAYAKGTLSPKDAPMIVELDGWPEQHKELTPEPGTLMQSHDLSPQRVFCDQCPFGGRLHPVAGPRRDWSKLVGTGLLMLGAATAGWVGTDGGSENKEDDSPACHGLHCDGLTEPGQSASGRN